MDSISLIAEVSDQELAGTVGDQAGGLFTVPGTTTVGHYCTISWECAGFICGK